MYEELITTGGWLDLVDEIASRHVGPILLAARATVTLRQHAWLDPGWVRAFVDDHPQLSGLSRREATEYI